MTLEVPARFLRGRVVSRSFLELPGTVPGLKPGLIRTTNEYGSLIREHSQ